MKKEIHELRVRIDGLARLVESFSSPTLIVDKNLIPDGMDIEELSKAYRSAPLQITNLTKGKQIAPSFNPNLYESHKSLLLAKAWLGKVLEELGEETPYKNDGKRKSVEDIEEAADSNEEVPFGDEVGKTPFRDKEYIEQIDWLREAIREVINPVICLKGLFSVNAFTCLCEARFHLGFELQRIKER